MSYILEALKKLEDKRRRAETPQDLLTAPAEAQQDVERRPLWHYMIALLLLLNAGLLLWWLRPWRIPVNSGLKMESSQSPALVYEPGPGNEKDSLKTRPDGAASEGKGGSLQAALSSADDVTAAEKPGVTGTPDEKKDMQKIYGLNDLPASVRQELPDIMISGHFYTADTSSRVVVINGRAMHEGESVAGGLRLERITPDGVVMEYQGYRFRRGVF